jgi:hypothetical protein
VKNVAPFRPTRAADVQALLLQDLVVSHSKQAGKHTAAEQIESIFASMKHHNVGHCKTKVG